MKHLTNTDKDVHLKYYIDVEKAQIDSIGRYMPLKEYQKKKLASNKKVSSSNTRYNLLDIN